MPGTSDDTGNVSQLNLEIYFLIAKFLGSGPCKKTAEVLQEELREHRLLPRRVDWEGREHFRSYESLLQIYQHIAPTHLADICQRIGPILDKEIPPSVKGVTSLLGAGRQSILRTAEVISNPKWWNSTYSVLSHGHPLKPSANHKKPNFAVIHGAREKIGVARQDLMFQTDLYSHLTLLSRSLGHLSAVYCITFDRTGDYIITGADDHLVKIWSSRSGRLLATLRGHAGEVSDMAVNYENTLLATGSCDKTIRVWNLKTTAPVAVLHAHTGMITSLQFCPYSRGDSRYLASTGADGCVCFWQWNVSNNIFNPKPFKFIERSRAGAQMLCSSFSPGGIFLTTGNADHVVRVYCFTMGVPEKICELEMHSDRVDSIQYSHSESRFMSGSKDGTARIWRYERQQWKAIVLYMSQKLDSTTPLTSEDMKNSKLRVTMVSWTADDNHVLTAVSDYSIKLWDSHTGQLVQVLQGHENEAFVLENNLSRPNLLLTAGHDGYIILWDMFKGKEIYRYFNMIQGQGHGAVFDCKWSPDGQSFAATDSHGFILLFGFGSNDKYKKCPEDQFFHTDYRPLIRDANNYVLDEQTQQPPHLMPPPFLVDIDGNPHPPAMQKLVPGREHCIDQQLVPQMGVANNGDREVLDGSMADLQPVPAPEAAPPAPPQPAGGNDADIIDHMIDRLQREQDERLVAEGQEPLLSPRSQAEAAMPAFPTPSTSRYNSSGQEDEPQSSQSTSPRPGTSQPSTSTPGPKNISVWNKRVCVHPVKQAQLNKCADFRETMSDLEIKNFVFHRKKKPLPASEIDSSDSGSYIRTRRKKKSRHSYRTRSAQNEETAPNRLVTRALYDTDVEEYSTPQSLTQEEEEEEEENVDVEEDGDPLGINEEENQSDDMWKDTSDSDSSDYSDWAADGGQSLQPPKRRSQRTTRRRRWNSSDNEEDEDREEEQEEDEDTEVEDEDRSEDPMSPSPVVKKKRPPPVVKKKKESRKQRNKRQVMKSNITELREDFRPPEWLTECVPRKAPYHPQIGDELVYFRQGHTLYVQAVKNRNIYNIESDKNLPWLKRQQLREQELVKVIGIKYEIRPPRLVCLKLALIDPETSRMVGGHFTVKYHDMPDVIDFLVLKQTYDTAIRRGWKQGDRFRCMIDDMWWLGTIQSQEPLDEEYQDSMFQCFNVAWDNGEFEKMSPWDLEPIDESRLPNHRGGSVPVTDEEIQAVLYHSNKASEWPSSGIEAECERLSRGFEQIMELSVAEWFLAPVDLNAFPIYAMVIEYPIDLNLIKTRIDNRFYRRIQAIQYDVRLIENNAVSFNQPGTDIVANAGLVSELCLRFISDPDCTDIMPLYNELHHDAKFAKQDDTPEPSSNRGLRGSGSSSRAPRRRLSSAQVSDPDAWKQQCLDLIDMILESDDSAPFRSPVDILEYPDYETIVDTPMDFGTIHEQLSAGNYHNPQEIIKDARLVFHNSKIYNTNTRSRIYAMTLRLSAMFEEQMKEILEEFKRAKKQGKQPASHSRHSPVTRRKAKSSRISPVKSQRESSRHSTPQIESSRASNTTTRSSSRIAQGGSASSGPSSMVRRREEQLPRRGSKRRRISSGSEDRKRPAHDSDTEIEGDKTSSDEETEIDDDDDDDDNGSGPCERPRSTTMRRLKALKRAVASGSGIVNGNRSSPSPSPKGRGFKKPTPPSKATTSKRGRYSTRTKSGAIQRRKYQHQESDESVTPPSKRRPRRVINDPESEQEEEDEEEAESSADGSSSSDSSDKENNEESDSGTEEYSADEANVPPKRSPRVAKRPSRLSDDFLVDNNRRVRNTRNKGKRTVNYDEDSDEHEETAAVSVSSRGRVRKISARARGIVFGD